MGRVARAAIAAIVRRRPDGFAYPKMRKASRQLSLQNPDGTHKKYITTLEAQKLVDRETADPIIPGGWRNRTDIEWEAVRLRIPHRNNESPASISASEMRVNAGAYSDRHSPSYVEMVRAKVEVWPFVGDTRAVSVRPRV